MRVRLEIKNTSKKQVIMGFSLKSKDGLKMKKIDNLDALTSALEDIKVANVIKLSRSSKKTPGKSDRPRKRKILIIKHTHRDDDEIETYDAMPAAGSSEILENEVNELNLKMGNFHLPEKEAEPAPKPLQEAKGENWFANLKFNQANNNA